MRVPTKLKGEGKDFWQRNARWLEAAGRLNESTRDAFLLLCKTWGTLHDTPALDPIKEVALGKQVQNMMSTFGMNPAANHRLKKNEQPPPDAPDKYGL